MKKPSGYIFAIQLTTPGLDSRHGLIRIGFSRHPLTRIHIITKGGRFKHTIRFIGPGNIYQERAIHWLLRSDSVRPEWYHPTGQVIQLIDTLKNTVHEFGQVFIQLPIWMHTT